MPLFNFKHKENLNQQRTLQQRRGDSAEDIACKYLQQQGLKFITRNYRCRYGEIDLIMQTVDEPFELLVFVEVRHRKTTTYGSGLDSINYHKQKKLNKTANHYLSHQTKNIDQNCRFDVISIDGLLTNNNVTWLKNAI